MCQAAGRVGFKGESVNFILDAEIHEGTFLIEAVMKINTTQAVLTRQGLADTVQSLACHKGCRDGIGSSESRLHMLGGCAFAGGLMIAAGEAVEIEESRSEMLMDIFSNFPIKSEFVSTTYTEVFL